MKYGTVLLFGPPGSGKGTWGSVLESLPGFTHISSGDMFRNLNPNNEIGATCMNYINQGKLVPDELTIDLWQEQMNNLIRSGAFDPDKSFLLLDGLPRNINQAEILADALDVRCILEMNCPDQELLFSRLRRRALKEHRLDDASDETVRHRFEVYQNITSRMLACYPEDILVQINVSVPVLDILQQISTALSEKLRDQKPIPASEIP